MTILAVKKSEISPQGPTHANAVHVVTMVKADPREGKPVRLVVSSYVDQAAYEAAAAPYTQRSYRLTMQAEAAGSTLDWLWAQLKAEAAQHGGFFVNGTLDVTALATP